jgi:hypothetical protein
MCQFTINIVVMSKIFTFVSDCLYEFGMYLVSMSTLSLTPHFTFPEYYGIDDYI